MAMATEKRDVYVYVFDTLADWEVGHAIGYINSPEYQKRPGHYRVRSVGVTRAPVKTTGGLTIVPDITLDEVTPSATALLILPGGTRWEDGSDQSAVLAKVVQLRAADVPIAAICGATAGLARAGLLDKVAHTSNAKQYLEHQPGYRGAAHYRDQDAVRDGGIITAGSTASVAFARAIFEQLDLYSPRVLDAWYGLFSTGEARYYIELVSAAS
ncbi:MAG: type 1 glutamine amidotransferase family protein [Polyangiales bacterium]